MKRHALRLAAWGLGIAAMLALATSSARAEFIEYTTSVTIDQTPGSYTPAGATFPTGTEIVTQGSYTQTAPFAGILTPNGNQVNLIGLASNPNPPHTNTILGGSDIVFAQIDASSSASTSTVDHVAFNYTFTLTILNYPGINTPSASPTRVPPRSCSPGGSMG